MSKKEGAVYIALLVAGSALDNENPIIPVIIVIAALATLLGQATGRW